MSAAYDMRMKIQKNIILWGLAVVACALALYASVFLRHGSSSAAGSRYSSHSGALKNPRGQYADLIRPNTPYHVDRVVDGDTMVVNIGGHAATIRLIGIDTPEVVDPRKPVQCFGREASDEGKRLLTNADVYLETDPLKKSPYDLYGRILAYLKLPGGIFYNEYMIENGFAREYTFNHERYSHQDEFKKAQAAAENAKTGLWNPEACVRHLDGP